MGVNPSLGFGNGPLLSPVRLGPQVRAWPPTFKRRRFALRGALVLLKRSIGQKIPPCEKTPWAQRRGLPSADSPGNNCVGRPTLPTGTNTCWGGRYIVAPLQTTPGGPLGERPDSNNPPLRGGTGRHYLFPEPKGHQKGGIKAKTPRQRVRVIPNAKKGVINKPRHILGGPHA